MRSRSSASLALLMTLALLSIGHVRSAHASLIAADAWAAGDGRLTTDTATGLSWLDLTVTNNKSYADIFLHDYGGLLSLGFRAPTLSEVAALLHDAGSPPGPIPTSTQFAAATYSAAATFISLFGCTACGFPYSEGYVVSDTFGAQYAWAETRGNGTGGFGMSGVDQFSFESDFGLTHHQLGSGFYLVMNTASIHGFLSGEDPGDQGGSGSNDQGRSGSTVAVPAPTTSLLFVLGIVTVAFIRLRRIGCAALL